MRIRTVYWVIEYVKKFSVWLIGAIQSYKLDMYNKW
jgi:hypothetical protein